MLGLEKHGVHEYKDPYSQLWAAQDRGESPEQHDLDAVVARFEEAGLPTDVYGVADSPEQFFAKYRGLATDLRHFASDVLGPPQARPARRGRLALAHVG